MHGDEMNEDRQRDLRNAIWECLELPVGMSSGRVPAALPLRHIAGVLHHISPYLPLSMNEYDLLLVASM